VKGARRRKRKLESSHGDPLEALLVPALDLAVSGQSIDVGRYKAYYHDRL
jgi:hypothetical protein